MSLTSVTSAAETLATYDAASNPSVIGLNRATGFPVTDPPKRRLAYDGFAAITLAEGTNAISRDILVDGRDRRFVVIKPDVARYARPPVIFLLHPDQTTPELTTYFTRIPDFVLTQGFWVVLPKSDQYLGQNWDDDPSFRNSPNIDVPFINRLLDLIIAEGADATRIYAAGFSNGGFMTERLACELSERFAAFGIVAATMKPGLAETCRPARQRPKLYFLGTSDLIVPYNGSKLPGGKQTGSADGALAFWAARNQQGCYGKLTQSQPINQLQDSTQAVLRRYSSCSLGSELGMWTIEQGGHQWPGGRKGGGVGIPSQEVSATGLLWIFFSQFRL